MSKYCSSLIHSCPVGTAQLTNKKTCETGSNRYFLKHKMKDIRLNTCYKHNNIDFQQASSAGAKVPSKL